jgi:hypothetical protein
MNQEITLPDFEEIPTWHSERCHLERLRLRNELAFICGDRSHGGPSREDLAARLKFLLAAIGERIDNLGNAQALAVLPPLTTRSRRGKQPMKVA